MEGVAGAQAVLPGLNLSLRRRTPSMAAEPNAVSGFRPLVEGRPASPQQRDLALQGLEATADGAPEPAVVARAFLT